MAVTVSPVQQGDGPTARYTGTLRPHRRVDLAFRVGGYVQSLLMVQDTGGGMRPVQAGDTVRAAVVLARLQSTDFQAQSDAASADVTAAQATVREAQGKLSQAHAGERQAADAVTEARAARQAAQAELGQAVSGVGQATAGVAEAQAALTLAQSDFARADDLYHSGSATRPQEDTAKASLDGAVAKRQAAQQTLAVAQGRVAEATANVRVAQARIRRAQSDVTASREASAEASAAISGAQAQVVRADAARTAQRVPVAQTVLRAPITGVVLGRWIEVGSLVGPGSPAFSLADTTRLDVTFGIPENAARRVRAGQRLALTLGMGNAVHRIGTVTEIDPTADEKTGVFGIQVTVPNADRALKTGMVATVHFASPGTAVGALTVPLSALVQSHDRPGGDAVMVIVDANGRHTIHLQDVQLGSSVGDQIVVRGLSPGTQIVGTAPSLLSDGEAVQVSEAADR